MSDYLKIARQVLRDLKAARVPENTELLERVLKGQAIELWSDSTSESYWLVADEHDAAALAERRGVIYTASEAQRIIEIADPEIVAEIRRWKRQFDATLVGDKAKLAG